MKLFRKERAVSTLVILCLVLFLVILAALQFRWSSEVCVADSARMRARLQSSLLSFRLDLQRELGAVCFPFQSLPSGAGLDGYAEAYRAWSRSTPHPGLVARLYVLNNANTPNAQLLSFDPESGTFQRSPLPPSLGPLPERLVDVSANVLRILNDFGGGDPGDLREGTRRRLRFHPLAELWAVEQNVPALVHPVAARFGAHPGSLDWIILQLDPRALSEEVMPELAERYFAGPDGLEYYLAAISGEDRVLYLSDRQLSPESFQPPAAVINLLGGGQGPPPPRGLLLSGNEPPGSEAPSATGPPRGPHDFGFALVRFDPIHYTNEDKDWRLVVKHRRGSLDAVVASMRRRNLELSFGVLAILAVTMALIIINTHRAQRLARLQMDFVTGISHELRTPLAVIRSAADNIADGFVEGREQVVRYGEAIRKQARQLTHLIDQVLMFATTRRQRLQFSLRPLKVEAVVGAAVNNTAELVAQSGFRIEQNVAPELPDIMGDAGALSHCLQNLITNAVKYGGRDCWIGVRAALHGADMVRITVEDHGVGIKAAELRHIFEPFYRSPQVIASQIHGTGLGLTLARSVAEAMGGRLSASSEAGKGSAFYLDLRAAVVSSPCPADAAPESAPAE